MSGPLDAERVLEGDSCRALALASVWLIAQALRSLGAAHGGKDSAPAAGSPPVAEPAAALAELAARAESPPPIAAEVRALELAVGAFWDTGALPSSTLALGVEGGWSFGNWRFALRPRVFIPNRALPADPRLGGVSARIFLVEMPLQACYAWSIAAFRLGPCASVTAGVMWGSSDGLPDARTSAGIWLAAEFALAAAWRVSERLGLRAELGLARPLRVPRFVIGPASELHRSDGWLIRPGIGVGMLF
jgi:hypothetical protein